MTVVTTQDVSPRNCKRKVLHVVGARPNFPKLAPVYHALARHGWSQSIVDTGQHYDPALSSDFIDILEIPRPDFSLGVGSASHAQQTAQILLKIEPVLMTAAFDWVLVYGDVNSTLAASLAATKLGLKVAHVEAGLRSFDRRMPEELNRLATDAIADLLFAPSEDAADQLRREAVREDRISLVGNVMIDSLFALRGRAQIRSSSLRDFVDRSPILVTLHRPSNVDDPHRLSRIVAALNQIAIHSDILFAVHPRTRERLQGARLSDRIVLVPPLSYLEVIYALERTNCVITDSGGLQEETTALGVPCVTLRENTERPITLKEGTNRLCPEPEALDEMVASTRRDVAYVPPALWDGHAADRIAVRLNDSA